MRALHVLEWPTSIPERRAARDQRAETAAGRDAQNVRGRNYQDARCRRLAALSPEWLRTIGPFAFYIDQCALFFAKSLPQAGGWLRRYARRGCGISE